MQEDVYYQDGRFQYPIIKTISGPFPVVHSIDDFDFNSVIEKTCHLDSLLAIFCMTVKLIPKNAHEMCVWFATINVYGDCNCS